MKLVEQYGGIYNLTNKEYKEMINAIAHGLDYDLPENRYIGAISACPLNMDRGQAVQELADIKCSK